MNHALPPPAAGWFPLSYAIGTDRRLARLSATVDVWSKWESWSEGFIAGSQQGRGRLIADDTMGRIEVFAGHALINALDFPLETPFPKFDRLSDGRWVVTDARCPPGARNACILAPDGSLLSRIGLGDGIAH